MNEREIQELIKGWHRNKAMNETDPFFRFMCHWICLNAWLAYRSNKPTDRSMLEWLKRQTPAESDLITSYENMKATTTGMSALHGLVSMSPIRDESGHRDSVIVADVNDRDNVIEAIYRIRCNLFHGSKSSTKSRDVELVSCANRIMTKWVGDLVAIW